jgi:hypothetical protein
MPTRVRPVANTRLSEPGSNAMQFVGTLVSAATRAPARRAAF